MKTYPVCLISLEQRCVVVIGGGKVATRKVQALRDAGAQVTVISPVLTQELTTLAAEGSIAANLRPYQAGDLQGAFLSVVATDDPLVNQAAWEEAQQAGCLINVVDDPQHSNFILPAVIRRGDLTIAISTGGDSPALARRLREKLEEIVGFEYGQLADLMAEIRPDLLTRFPPGEARLQAALAVIDNLELMVILKRDGVGAAKEFAYSLWGSANDKETEARSQAS